MYFDIDVGANDLLITGFDTNTLDLVAFDIDFYTVPGTSVGNETNAGAWTLVASGTGTGQGADVATFITLDAPFLLSANTSYGFAIVMGPAAGHDYTNGTGANEFYSNADLSLTLGGASNTPFTAGIFTPRVWNGTIYYEGGTVPEPATLLLLGAGLALAARARARRRSS